MLNAMKKIIKNDKLKFQLLGARDFREGFKKRKVIFITLGSPPESDKNISIFLDTRPFF